MEILGVRIDPISSQKIRPSLERLLLGEGSHLIATPNPEILVHAYQNPEYREVLNRATLNVPDGVGLQFAAKALGGDIKERITGMDLIYVLASLAAEHGKTMLFLGAEEGIGERAAEILRRTFPGLNIHALAGGWITRLGNGSWISEQDLLSEIKKHEPEVLCVAFGHGKQEHWIYDHLKHLPSVRLGVGIGGAFDFYAGKAKRAPSFMRRIGLEWLWRLFHEPRRFKRIINAVIIFPLIVLRHRYES